MMNGIGATDNKPSGGIEKFDRRFLPILAFLWGLGNIAYNVPLRSHNLYYKSVTMKTFFFYFYLCFSMVWLWFLSMSLPLSILCIRSYSCLPRDSFIVGRFGSRHSLGSFPVSVSSWIITSSKSFLALNWFTVSFGFSCNPFNTLFASCQVNRPWK